MRMGIFLFCFLFILLQIDADTVKVSATYSVPVIKRQFNESENPTYKTSAELEDKVCDLEAPEYIRYLLPSSLAGESLPILLKKTIIEGKYHYYTGKNVSEAKCVFSPEDTSKTGICFITYDKLDVDLAQTLDMAQKEFSIEGAESISNRMRASMLFASSEPAGFLHFQYDCTSAEEDKEAREDISK